MDGFLRMANVVNRMSLDIVKFAVAMQKCFVRCGVCNIINCTTVLVYKERMILCITKLILEIMLHIRNHNVFQL